MIADSVGDWSLAPGYDITYAYNPESNWTHQHLMSVNGKFADITRKDIAQVAERFDIFSAQAIVDEVEAAVARFPEFAGHASVPKTSVDEITAGTTILPRR